MEQAKQSSWNVDELSHLYHLIMWGYKNKEVAEILVKEGFPRTMDALTGQVSIMRKYVSRELGMPVQGLSIGSLTEDKFLKASNAGVPAMILAYKKNVKEIKPPRPSPGSAAPSQPGICRPVPARDLPPRNQ